MGQPIDIVAQYAMDAFYQNFRAANSDFFTLPDFIYHVGATLADAYNEEYKQQYSLIRAERRDDLVAFDPSWLNEQRLKVERKDGQIFAKLDEQFMNFTYDQSSVGLQSVFSSKPTPGIELERTSLNQKWQLTLMPNTNRIFFVPLKNEIQIIQKGDCNTTEIQIYYAPAISDKMVVPDGLVRYAIDTTVIRMKELKTGILVKKSMDGNPNSVPATEIDKLQAK
jgi:hypothetical protein